jgi:hypothetical protein
VTSTASAGKRAGAGNITWLNASEPSSPVASARRNRRAMRCQSGSAASIAPIATVEILVGGGSTVSGVIENEQPSMPPEKAIAASIGRSLRSSVDDTIYPRWTSRPTVPGIDPFGQEL